MTILVTGGAGHLGREVVRVALAAGHTVRIMSRRPRPADAPQDAEWATADLATGAGIREAVEGIDAVVHAASDPRPWRTTAVDVEGTKRLVSIARDAGVRHLLYVSIVGIDRIPYSYYQRKLIAEQIVAESGVPYSILRATQFHSFIDLLLGVAARTPFVLPIPAGFQVQSVADEDVADRILRALDQGPGGRLQDYAGPECMTVTEATVAWKAARGVHKTTLPIPLPGNTAAAFRAGLNLAPDAELGTIRWREWLETHPPTRLH